MSLAIRTTPRSRRGGFAQRGGRRGRTPQINVQIAQGRKVDGIGHHVVMVIVVLQQFAEALAKGCRIDVPRPVQAGFGHGRRGSRRRRGGS